MFLKCFFSHNVFRTLYLRPRITIRDSHSMNTVVITGSGPVACPGFFHFGPLRTALVEARRVVLVHAWNYSANKDLKRFLRRDEIRVLDTVSIERFVSFTDVTHAVTLHGESDPWLELRYLSALRRALRKRQPRRERVALDERTGKWVSMSTAKASAAPIPERWGHWEHAEHFLRVDEEDFDKTFEHAMGESERWPHGQPFLRVDEGKALVSSGYAEREKLWPALESNLGQSGRTVRTITSANIQPILFFGENQVAKWVTESRGVGTTILATPPYH